MTNPITDFAKSDCLLVIGSNFAENHPIVSRWVFDAKDRGAKLIVVDPRFTSTAWTSDVFLQLLPGTDTSLINALMHVIIEEDLYDKRFVAERTTGIEDLRRLVSAYSPERAQNMTSVPAEKIVHAARAYAQAEAATLIYCMGVAQHTCGTETVINCANLAMLCGHIGRPGTGVNPLRGQDNVQGACDVGALANVYPGYRSVTDPEARARFAEIWGCNPESLSSNVGLTVIQMTDAILNGDLRAMLVMGENPIVGDPNSAHARQAFERLEFLAVFELFLSETAELADVVLPAASFAEKRGTKTTTDRRVQWFEKAIEPIGEARPDWNIICNLAERLGLHKRFRYENEEEILEEINRAIPGYAGIQPDRVQSALGGIPWPCPSSEHPGTPILYVDGFNKPDRRGVIIPVEYKPPFEQTCDEFPLVLTTGRVVMHYNTGTMTRRTRALHEREPALFVQVHPATARRLGISDRGKARVSTRRGNVEVIVKVTQQIAPGVVFMPFHFPATNLLTVDALDPEAMIPEYKVAACSVSPLNGKGKESGEQCPESST
jgi:predicted molibdopterin-dependent oxidoreductase YjgC